VPTIAPPREQGEVGQLFIGQDQIARVRVQDEVWAPRVVHFLAINLDALSNANVHLAPEAKLILAAKTSFDFQLDLVAGSEIFVNTGPFRDGMRIDLAGSDLQFYGGVDTCLAINYRAPTELTVSCYQGVCSFGVRSQGGTTPLPTGEQWSFDADASEPVSEGAIPPAEIGHYYDEVLPQHSAGMTDRTYCIGQRDYLTPTPTPTRTRVPPTWTPEGAQFTAAPTIAPYGGGFVFADPDRPGGSVEDARYSARLWGIALAGYALVAVLWAARPGPLRRLAARLGSPRRAWVRVAATLANLIGIVLLVWYVVRLRR
jgi:hypothetical protein